MMAGAGLIELARGADVLVPEAMVLPALDRLIAGESNAVTLREHLLASHRTAEEAGEIAAAAGVKRLVLSHFVPGGDASLTDADWQSAAADQMPVLNGVKSVSVS
jgi:ribonuclease BN (tRNA processing enzyme)